MTQRHEDKIERIDKQISELVITQKETRKASWFPMFNSELTSIDSQIADLKYQRNRLLDIVEKGTAPAQVHVPEEDYSKVWFYSELVKKYAHAKTPFEQLGFYFMIPTSIVGLGYSGKYFFNSYHLNELTKYDKKTQSINWKHHWARSGVKNQTEIELAEYWVKVFRVRAVIGLGPPGLLLWFLVSKYRKVQ